MRKKMIWVLLGLMVVVAGSLVAWRLTADGRNTSVRPADTAADSRNRPASAPASETEKRYASYLGEDYDRYYVANMIMHHMGAVHMAELARTAAKHGEIKTLADSIITSQSAEIVDMRRWQKEWNYPPSEGGGMMDHSAMGMEDDMHGMMMGLQAKTGEEFDEAFLSEMISHHQSAIDMSKPAAANAKHQEVKDLAAAVIAAQSREIGQMKRWQQDWGYAAGASQR